MLLRGTQFLWGRATFRKGFFWDFQKAKQVSWPRETKVSFHVIIEKSLNIHLGILMIGTDPWKLVFGRNNGYYCLIPQNHEKFFFGKISSRTAIDNFVPTAATLNVKWEWYTNIQSGVYLCPHSHITSKVS